MAERKVDSAGDSKTSDEPARGKPASVDGEVASGSSKSEQAGGAVSATDEARPAQPQPATVANTGNTADRRGAEKIDAAPLSLADRTEIEQQLHQWREGIWIDITLLLGWSGELAVTIPPKSMEYFRELQPNLRNESFLRLAFDWEGSGREILNHDQITATLLNNLHKALRRYVQRAIDLISSKWADKGLHPSAFASRMKSAGEALEDDVFQLLRDGVSALAHGASTDSLEQALSGNIRTRIAREVELYRRNAQLTGLCELPERDAVVAEYRATDESVSPLLEDVSTPPLPGREQPDTARADSRGSHEPARAELPTGAKTKSGSGPERRQPVPNYPARASWLKDRLLERGWSNSDPSEYEGPDRKTVQKILRGEAVRNDVLQKLADALSKRHDKVNVLDIPQD